MPFLVSAAVFAVVTGILISAHSLLTAESPVARRLRAMVPEPLERARGRLDASVKAPGFWRRAIIGLGRFGFTRESTTLADRLSAAGLRGPSSVGLFLGIRTLLSFGPALLILVSRISAGKPVAPALWLAAVVGACGHLLANIWLRRRSARRIQQITEALADALDLMVVCLESGLGLNSTIARVGEERAALQDALGQEFEQVSLELHGGRSREEALRALGTRNGVEDLKALTALIVQSDRLGASMAKTLRTHADLLRVKRRQRAEEAARKLPIKVLFPLATLLLPPLFIMVMGPAFLSFKELIKMITGR